MERGAGSGKRGAVPRGANRRGGVPRREPRPAPRSLASAVALAVLACANAGSDRVLSVEATGFVIGLVYFDADGDREPAPPDTAVLGVRVRLVLEGSGAVVGSAVSDSAGRFRIGSLAARRYEVQLDTATVPESVSVVRIADSTIQIGSGGSATVVVAVSFPSVSVSEARLLAPGARVFVSAIALNGFTTFGDSTIHIVDGGRAIRVTGVTPVPVLAGDSLRVLGSVGVRDGQPVLTGVTAFPLPAAVAPVPAGLTTAVARTADGGRLDAALAAVTGATISDTATTGAGDFALIVTDGSGALEVLLNADLGLVLTPYVPGAVIDVSGVLVPAGPGVWRLKPRSGADLQLSPPGS